MILLIGCFGNHPFDRAMERELYRHLEEEQRLQNEIEGIEEYEEDPDAEYDRIQLEKYNNE